MNYKDFEDLLDELIAANQNYLDYLRREDWIQWTPEAEKQAADEYFNLRRKLIELLEKGSQT